MENTMDSETYVRESERTESLDVPAITARITDAKLTHALATTTKRAIEVLRDLDMLKKHIFYGKVIDLDPIVDKGYDLNISYNETDVHERLDIENIRLLHAGIGIATEAGEILEQLNSHIVEGKSLDKINLAEEVGDLAWYEAIISRITGQSFGTIRFRNIAKLRARFPTKFTTEAALNRNLNTEREILEGRQ